jgi:hypothetical protein
MDSKETTKAAEGVKQEEKVNLKNTVKKLAVLKRKERGLNPREV